MEPILTESYEDYIEAIYDLAMRSDGIVRSVDVAAELGVTKASVARAVKNLREGGFIEQQHYGVITLTDQGRELGERILQRHRVLRAFLIDILGVDEELANDEACRMEHTISQDTMEKWAAWFDEQNPNYTNVNEGTLKRKE